LSQTMKKEKEAKEEKQVDEEQEVSEEAKAEEGEAPSPVQELVHEWVGTGRVPGHDVERRPIVRVKYWKSASTVIPMDFRRMMAEKDEQMYCRAVGILVRETVHRIILEPHWNNISMKGLYISIPKGDIITMERLEVVPVSVKEFVLSFLKDGEKPIPPRVMLEAMGWKPQDIEGWLAREKEKGKTG